MASPLAAELRPKTLDEVFGQEHILAEGGVLRRVVAGGTIPNMIFYGPSGVGKTTVARIIAATAGKKLCHLNGTTASTADIKDVVAQQDTIDGRNGVLLYLDEIQYLNKKQQQSLLECIENGTVTLIASTTENPYFYVYNAILSRSSPKTWKRPCSVLCRWCSRKNLCRLKRAHWPILPEAAGGMCARLSTPLKWPGLPR